MWHSFLFKVCKMNCTNHCCLCHWQASWRNNQNFFTNVEKMSWSIYVFVWDGVSIPKTSSDWDTFFIFRGICSDEARACRNWEAAGTSAFLSTVKWVFHLYGLRGLRPRTKPLLHIWHLQAWPPVCNTDWEISLLEKSFMIRWDKDWVVGHSDMRNVWSSKEEAFIPTNTVQYL